MMLKRGFFITVEGPEGSGKSTLALYLKNRLEHAGLSCLLTYEPGDHILGEHLRKILLQLKKIKMSSLAELFLFEADRCQHVKDIIIPALEKKKIVICVRFCDSTTAYQGHGRQMDLKMVEYFNRAASLGVSPDLTLLLDIDPKPGLTRAYRARGEKDRMESEAIKFHQRVRRGFLTLARQNKKRFCVIDANQKLEKVQEQALSHVRKFLEDKS